MFTTNEERMTILKIIEDDKIDAEQGLKLLEALNNKIMPEKDKTTTRVTEPVPSEKNGHFFRVLITNTATGKTKTQVTLPMNLVNWGLRIGAHFSPEVAGLDMDELAEILQSSSQGKIVDVLDEESQEHVEIYID